jgi:PAS domain S-box-containing protein
MKDRPRIQTILFIILPTYLAVVLFIFLIFSFLLPRMEQAVINKKKEMIREQTRTSISLARQYQRKSSNGTLTVDEAQKRVLKHLEDLRYGSDHKDYFWIMNFEPRVLMHPYREDLEGKNLNNYRDPAGKLLFRDMVRVCREKGSGFVKYHWQWKDNPDRIAPKLSYVQTFHPWDWIIGTGVYINDVHEEIDSITRGFIHISVAMLILVTLLLSFVVYRAIRGEKERLKAVNRSRRDSERIRRILDTTNEGFWVIDREAIILDVNPELCSMLDMERENILGINVYDLVVPEERDLLDYELNRREHGYHGAYELNLRRKDGSLIYCIIKATPYYNESGIRTGSFALLTDITDLKMTESDLVESRERYRIASEKLEGERQKLLGTLESIAEAVIVTDKDGVIELFNPAAETLTGLSAIHANGFPLEEILQVEREKSDEKCLDLISRVSSTGLAVRCDRELVILNRDGEERICSAVVSPISDSGQFFGVIMVIIDETRRVMIDEELLKANRIESLGVFAGGIAHDFNNLLTSIMGNVSLARTEYKHDEKIVDILNDIEQISGAIGDLSRQLLTFSRGGEPIRRPVNLKSLLKDTATMTLSGASVTFTLDYPDNLWNVNADESQIRQVVNNLIINALQSIEGDGSIIIQAWNGEGKPGEENSHVYFAVEDNGSGIPPDVMSRIFDPYYTTREKGHGLGLAVSYSIIRRHNGDIRAESTPGEGSRFTVRLPSCAAEVEPDGNESDFTPPPNQRVLIMDDEAHITSLLEKMLTELGYRVVTTARGEEAIEAAREGVEKGTPFDLAIMDLTVPGGMGGAETMKRIHEIMPGITGIVSSGYSNDPILANYRDYGFSAVLEKPYRYEDLKKVLGSIY